jgi:hypothetical protein
MRIIVVLAVILTVLTGAGCLPTLEPPAATAPGGALAALPVRPEDTTTPYDRDQWGDWANHGHSCDTRELVLTDQGHHTTPGAACRPGCVLGSVCWLSPYDGARLRDPADVHVDHRVPLAEAHRSGAADWTREQRERFYNDPTNLVAASAESNTSKGDNDPAHWRPTNHAVWCDYATAYVATKDTYGLAVDPAEHDALAAMLTTCLNGGAAVEPPQTEGGEG